MTFNRIAAALGVIVSLVVIYQFIQERKKNSVNTTNPNNNTANDANKQVGIVNPVLTNGAIVQTQGGSLARAGVIATPLDPAPRKPNNILWLGLPQLTPDVAITSPANVPSNQSNTISAVSPIRGDIVTAGDLIATTGQTALGTMFGDNLPDPSLQQIVPFPNLPTPTNPSSAIDTSFSALPLMVRADAPTPQPASFVTRPTTLVPLGPKIAFNDLTF